MHDRIFAGVTLLLCCTLGYFAWGYSAPFSYEPVGPKSFPLLLLLLIAFGCVQLLLKPASGVQSDEPPLNRQVMVKALIFLGLMIGYAVLFETFGFVPASVLFGIGMARLYGGSWLQSLLSGVVLALGLYLLFDRALDVPLPLGILAALEN
nr:tripartite tricarboxylate transporter TctB family protein [Pseudomonas chengduensis]